MKYVVLLLALVMVVRWVTARAMQVSREDAHALVANGALLIDVRTPSEFAGGHLPGARNVPLDRLEAEAPRLGGPATSLVVYCRSGGRSSSAASTLRRLGFTTVADLGGLHRW